MRSSQEPTTIDGEIFGFLGPSGAGRTTTLLPPSGGEATVAGHCPRALFTGHLGDPSVPRGLGIMAVLAVLAVWWVVRSFRQATA